MTRRLALLPLAFVAGCLYTGSRNHPPSVTVELSPSLARLGQPIIAGVAVEDDQHDIDLVRSRIQVQVLDANQNVIDDACVATVVPNGYQTQLFVYQPGDYWVAATTSDEWGASATSMVTLHVSDSPPVFSGGAHVESTSPKSACQSFTAGQAVIVDLVGMVSDPDNQITPATGAASCSGLGDTLVYTWKITSAPKAAQPRLGPLVGGACPGAAADSGTTLVVPDDKAQICLYTDASVFGAVSEPAALYALTLLVDDGVNPPVQPVSPLEVRVRNDQPACILGSDPGLGLRVVDRSVPQTFTITGVADDLDPYPSGQLRFLWSVWRTSDPVWRAVDDDRPDYQLDTSGYDVGEDVQVRVEVVDRTGARASCALDVDACLESSCVVPTPNSCQRWMTWSLELR